MANEIEYLHLQYVPTGNIFKIPADEAKEILKSDRGNYKILDEHFVDDVEEVEVTSTFEKVVDDATKDEIDVAAREEELNLKKVAELAEICKEKGIEIAKSDKKADLIRKILLDEEKPTEEIAEECKKCYADGKTPADEDCLNCIVKNAETKESPIEE